MPAAYIVSLLVVVLAAAAARRALATLPLRAFTLRLSAAEIVLAVGGLAGLAFHCAAMFFRTTVQDLPGTAGAITSINAMGPVSVVAFAVPSLLLLVALRRMVVTALAALATALTAVGITMYAVGSSTVHLAAIFVTVALLALCGAALLGAPPAQRRPPLLGTAASG